MSDREIGYKRGYIDSDRMHEIAGGEPKPDLSAFPGGTTFHFTREGKRDEIERYIVDAPEWSVTMIVNWHDHLNTVGLKQHQNPVNVSWEYKNVQAYKKWSKKCEKE